MRVVYMGTPDFAVGALNALVKAGQDVCLVVTQPDKAKGRSGQLQMPPVKECALSHGIEVIQPERLKTGEYYDKLRSLQADIFVVAAFGQILPKEVLEMPRLGCVNIHASLLPKLRGAAPIQWSILQGDDYSGITIMQMGEGLDTGDILWQEKVKIEAEDTADSLFDKLCETGAKLIVEVLPRLDAGEITPIPQDETLATYAGKLTKEYGLMDFKQSAKELELKVRGLNSWPSAYTSLNGKQLKIWKAVVISDKENAGKPGSVVKVDKEAFYVQTGDGLLGILELQLEGKKRMCTADFMRGLKIETGTVLG